MPHSKEDYNYFIISKETIHRLYKESDNLLLLAKRLINCCQEDCSSNCTGYSLCQTFHHSLCSSIQDLFDTPFPYQEYLHSKHWDDTRKNALKRASYKCQLCSTSTELHVHHNNYDNLWHETNADLIVLCKSCHTKFHEPHKTL